MAVIKIRMFETRTVNPYAPAETFTATLSAFTAEVNAFLATITPANILDIKSDIHPARVNNNAVLHQVTVIYME